MKSVLILPAPRSVDQLGRQPATGNDNDHHCHDETGRAPEEFQYEKDDEFGDHQKDHIEKEWRFVVLAFHCAPYLWNRIAIMTITAKRMACALHMILLVSLCISATTGFARR